MPKIKEELKNKDDLKKKATISKKVNEKTTDKAKKTTNLKVDEKLESKEKKNIKKGEKVLKNVKKDEEKTKASSKKVKSDSNLKKSEKKNTKKAAGKSKVSSKNKSNETKAGKTKIPKKPEFLAEYYDLPYRYNETVVKILAQTPKRLFVYWEVSEKDKETYMNAFGEDFFEKTYPVLLVHNEEMNYTFEVPINDFANSWYLDIQDTKSKYVVQLGRKFRNIQDVKPEEEIVQKEHINLQNDFVYITDSNKLETPNDHILFESLGNQVIYKNVKTGEEYKKNISDILEKLQLSYKDVNIEDIYRELYGEEISDQLLHNPSSGGLGLTSSGAISRV